MLARVKKARIYKGFGKSLYGQFYMEPLWKEVRKDGGFKNNLFNSLNDVVDKLCDTLPSIKKELVRSVCGWSWIVEMF